MTSQVSAPPFTAEDEEQSASTPPMTSMTSFSDPAYDYFQMVSICSSFQRRSIFSNTLPCSREARACPMLELVVTLSKCSSGQVAFHARPTGKCDVALLYSMCEGVLMTATVC